VLRLRFQGCAVVQAAIAAKKGAWSYEPQIQQWLSLQALIPNARLQPVQSGIHGWGLLARKEMKQDSMIIEYRGEALRRAMADLREKLYRAKDMDCYLFNINDNRVVDATMKGTIGRFTVSRSPPGCMVGVCALGGAQRARGDDMQ
jgi:hypothetical protein